MSDPNDSRIQRGINSLIPTNGSTSPALVAQGDDGEPTTTSLVVAQGTGVEHRAVLQLVRRNLADFEEFGRVAFEMRPFDTAGGAQHREVAVLNEAQATLLMTYMRNSEVVRAFKKRLVHAFFELRARLAARPQIMTREELLATAVVEANKAIAEMQPKAEKYDRLLSAEGDWDVSEAAGILQRSGIAIGEHRLFDYLHEIRWLFRRGKKWRVHQYAKERGWLAEKAQGEWINPETGEVHVRTPQVRVTPKGVDRLVEMLTQGRVG